MGEKQSAGNGDEDRKGETSTAGNDPARLHAPFKYRQGNDEHGEKTMQQHFGIRQSRPKTNRAERPSLRVAAKKKKCREAKESKRPIARPGNFSSLGHERQ